MRQTSEWWARQSDQVLEWRQQGWTTAAIAEELGATRNAVIGFIARARSRGDVGPVPVPDMAARLRWPVVMAPGCRWVIGDPQPWAIASTWRWCGEAPVPGSAYCRAHIEASQGRARQP